MEYYKRCGNGWIDLGLPSVLSDEISFQQLLYNVVHNLSELHDNFKDLYDYTINFLQNLDIDEKVKEYLDQIVQDGTLADLINTELLNRKVEKKHTLNSLYFQKKGVPDNEISAETITEEEFTNFLREKGVPYIPEGNYQNIEKLGNVKTAKIGNCEIYEEKSAIPVNVDPYTLYKNVNNDGIINHTVHTTNEKSAPIIAVSNIISDNRNTANLETAGAGLYSYIEQNGSASRMAPKSILGVSVNKSGGDNDSTGVVGYSYKFDVPGIESDPKHPAGVGDCAGSGGACWQLSNQKGLAIGGEFSCHQNAATKTTKNDGPSANNNSVCIHMTTASNKSPVANGFLVDSRALSEGVDGINKEAYGFWNLFTFAPSSVSQNGEGHGIEGTNIFNLSPMSDNFPDKVMKLGNANIHFSRDRGNIRFQADGFDFFDPDFNNPGIRIIGNTPFISFYKGRAGSDGKYDTTVSGNINCSQNGAISLRSYDVNGENDIKGVTISSELGSFFPSKTNEINLGRPTFLWKDIYAANGTINTSDARLKDDIEDVNEKILDAWEEVKVKQFKMKEAKEKKGDEARTHIGWIAQDIIEIFKKHNLDAFKLGLICTLNSPAESEEIAESKVIDIPDKINDAGEIVKEGKYHLEKTVVREAREARTEYALRYNECICLELACISRKLDRLMGL